MKLPEFSLNNPYVILAVTMVVVVLGSFAYMRTPTDLFPETVPPQVAIITVKPGAAANDVADMVTQVIEKELGSISGVETISSTSRDEVSAINVEFSFDKSIGTAVTDVQNAVARIRSDLPDDIQEPRLYQITDATRPLLTLSLTPGEDSLKKLADIRLLAENDLKDRILAVAGVGDVQVFGGHQTEIEVRVDRDALAAHNLSLSEIIAVISAENVAAPGGTIYTSGSEYLLKVSGAFSELSSLEDLPLRSTTEGSLYLRNVATIELGEADARSAYHGNGKESIALNILRPENGSTVEAIHNLKNALPEIESSYPDINFEITDDQQPLIDLNVSGMRSSLWQAIGLTVLIIFLFLGNLRAAGVVSVAIPLSFLAAMAVLWFSPYTLNMVTLSGLIVSVGMVVDASVVVLENIDRRYANAEFGTLRQAAINGAQQVAMPITAGMLTTIVVLIPVLFTGGYTGRIMKPLNVMIIATLIASLVISLTIIPILTARFMKKTPSKRKLSRLLALPMERLLEFLTSFYLGLVRWSLKTRWLVLLGALVFLVFSLRVVKPMLGEEQMPPMDTGTAIVEFDCNSSMNPTAVNDVLSRVETMLQQTPAVERISAVLGSEVNAISFGGGAATAQSARLTVYLLPRTERVETIWEIQASWREQLRTIPGVRSFRVSGYGATPVSTTKAPFNIVISGPDPLVLDQLADSALQRLRGVAGLTDLRRSWYRDKVQNQVVVDPELARLYATSPAAVATTLRTAVQGRSASSMQLEEYLDIPIRVRYQADQLTDIDQLEDIYIPTSYGAQPLRSMARIETQYDQPFLTREQLRNTIDITGGNEIISIAQVTKEATEQLADLSLPAGYNLEVAGTVRDMAESSAELGQALMLGLVLLFVLLLAMFKSFIHPITIMLSIPLGVAGAIWGLLLFDKPFCMPALMGIILLGGTIVNNAILMLDFILQARKAGATKDEAILQSVKLRMRPILITAVSTVIGFSPLIFEMAIGLERMSPLGIAAASGLLFGTVITLVIVPVLYSALDSLTEWWAGLFSAKKKIAGTMLLLLAIPFLGNSRVEAGEFLPSPLSLNTAIEIALRQNPDLVLATADIAYKQGTVLVAEAPKKLQLDAQVGASWYEQQHTMLPGVMPDSQAFANNLYQATVSASYLLTDFGQTEAALSAALLRQKAGLSQLARRQEEVVYVVARRYLSILSLRDQIKAVEASQKSVQALLTTTAELLAQGRAARIDLLKVKVRAAEIQNQLTGYQGELVKLRADLAVLIGTEEQIPPLEDVSINIDPAHFSENNSLSTQTDGLQRSDIVALAEEASATKKDVEAARRRFMPQLKLWAAAGIYGADDAVDTSSSAADDDWDEDYSVGLSLKIPLLDGQLRRGQLDQAQAKADMAEAALRKQRYVAMQELASAEADQQSALAQMAVNQTLVAEASEALRIERYKYEVGKGTVSDVLDSEASLLNAESLLCQSRRLIEVANLAESLARGEISVTIPAAHL
jgi:multidrug efflux pump subunit AcrB/outer membrane protein TolC